MSELVKHSSQDLESQHVGADQEISNQDANIDSLFTKYFELEKMFKETCYPIYSEKEGSTVRLNLSNRESFPSNRQHTKAKDVISEDVNDQQVPSTVSSIKGVQLKDDCCNGDLWSNVIQECVPSDDDNRKQISLGTLSSARESSSRERMDLEKGLLSREITPRGMLHGKRKFVEEKNKSIKKRPTVPVKAPIKKALIYKPNKQITMQVCQEKIVFSRASADVLKQAEFLNISPDQEALGIIKKSETLKTHVNGKLKMHQFNDVSSVRVLNGKAFDFRCIICKNLPRKLNRSELYRHYATKHFQRALKQEFGHLMVCPYCNIELNGSVASHFGQKHSIVERYLPAKAWIPAGWKSSSGETIHKNKIKEPLRNGKCMLPKVPTGFDNEGPGSTKRGLDVESTIVSIVDGFEIEHEKAIVAEQVQGGKRFAMNDFEIIECRICKRVFDAEQASVMHLQAIHGISVFEDVKSSISAFLTFGYIALKRRNSVLSVLSEVSSDSESRYRGVISNYEALLDEEEIQLLKEFDAKEFKFNY